MAGNPAGGLMQAADAFSSSYREARQKFLDATAQAGLQVQSHVHPLPGIEGETLAMDVAREGPADARNLLVITSACHGVEGYCGSGVQVFALHDEAWRAHARDAGVAVLYVHALNPYGFSFKRRVTHENVDLNRNFHDFSRPLPVNAGYRELHPLILPDVWPPDAANQTALGQYIATHSEKAYQSAISGGQHEFADGMFFGGHSPTWSNRTIRAVAREHGARAARLGWIDLHTGLGPSGVGERIFACSDDAAAFQRAKAWWDGGGKTPVTSIYDGSSTSAVLTGMLFHCVADECPDAEYTGLAMEYGTQPVLQVMQALRGDHWLHQHPGAAPDLAAGIRRAMMDAFYTDTDVWKGEVIRQARESMLQAVEGLAGRR